MIEMQEVIENQRYESKCGSHVLKRPDNAGGWHGWHYIVDGEVVDSGQFRDDIAERYNLKLIDMPRVYGVA